MWLLLQESTQNRLKIQSIWKIWIAVWIICRHLCKELLLTSTVVPRGTLQVSVWARWLFWTELARTNTWQCAQDLVARWVLGSRLFQVGSNKYLSVRLVRVQVNCQVFVWPNIYEHFLGFWQLTSAFCVCVCPYANANLKPKDKFSVLLKWKI